MLIKMNVGVVVSGCSKVGTFSQSSNHRSPSSRVKQQKDALANAVTHELKFVLNYEVQIFIAAMICAYCQCLYMYVDCVIG